MRESITYRFEDIKNCEMCGDSSRSHKVLGQRLNQSQGLRPKEKRGLSVSVLRCTNCGLIYASPLPVPANIQDHYGIPPEDYWKPSYFEWTPAYFSGEIKTAKRLLPFRPGFKALDIGAGIGKSMISLEKAGFEAYGFEPSEPFYNRAITRMNIDPNRLKLGMLEEMEYEEAFFDFITFGAVFEHLYHPAKGLQKALKWLKPGGLMQLEVPSADHLIPKLINFYYRLIGTNYVTNISPMHEPFHLYEFTLKSFEQLAKRLGFEIVFHEYYVSEIYFVPKPFHPVLRRYMRATNTGMQLAVWLKKINA